MDTARLPLFRQQALEARRPQGYGRIVLLHPISFSIVAGAAVLVACMLGALLVLGSYTEHTALVGQLIPDKGVIKVHPSQFGTIVEKRIAEGDEVTAGDVLFVISSERFTSTRGAAQSSIGSQLELQERSLSEQIDQTRRLRVSEQEALDRMIAALAAEETKVDAMIDSQDARVALASDTVARYEKMRSEGFVPEDQLIARRDIQLDSQSRKQSLEREKAAIERQLTDLRNQALSRPLTYQNQLAELDRAMAAVRRDLTENESRRLILVRAPEGGLAAAVIGEVGQFVDSSRPLLSIIPADSTLEAHLYAPSRAVGFIDVGDRVLLRYDAYPYQKFGHHAGTVVAVARTAVSVAELQGYGGGATEQTTEPLYRVDVALSSSAVTAYGKQHRLQAGMLVQGDVLLDTRRIYEWILEPLYSVSGKIHP